MLSGSACSEARVQTVAALVEEFLASRPDAELSLKTKAQWAQSTTTPDLIAAIDKESSPIHLWLFHLVLDRRDVPPCLRQPKRSETGQFMFITWLADVLWLCKRKKAGHQPFYTRWRNLFTLEPGKPAWQRTALWIYMHGAYVGHYHSKGLGLTDEDRQPLMTMLTNAMRNDREVLKQMPEMRDKLWLYSGHHPDRSGRFGATDIAAKRAELLRVFLLAGRSPTRAAAYLQALTGERMSRQALSRQIEHVEKATRMRLLSSRSLRRGSPPLVGCRSRTG